jgi:hypothetical protein
LATLRTILRVIGALMTEFAFLHRDLLDD